MQYFYANEFKLGKIALKVNTFSKAKQNGDLKGNKSVPGFMFNQTFFLVLMG